MSEHVRTPPGLRKQLRPLRVELNWLKQLKGSSLQIRKDQREIPGGGEVWPGSI